MIVQSEELSPNQKAAIEELIGRPLLDRETISVSTLPPSALANRQAAAEKLQKFLEETVRPRPGVSEEELEAAILEAIRSERPRFRPMP
jgi:hypothetical protein